MMASLQDCVVELYKIGGIKFGSFVLKSGLLSPFYVDLRVLPSNPKLLCTISNLMWEKASGKCDLICGVPYTALPIATAISINENIPMVIRRKEAKNYGTKKILEGCYSEGDSCTIIEDVIVSGSSIIETVEVVKKEGLNIMEAIVFIDRQHGGGKNLADAGVKTTCVATISEILNILKDRGFVDDQTVRNVNKFVSDNDHVEISHKEKRPLFSIDEKLKSTKHRVSEKLLKIIQSKQTNLCVAVDVSTSAELLDIARKVAPYICILKTHVDIISDFYANVISELVKLSTEHTFLLFEDRKFSDIGKTAKEQYVGGIYKISEWADLVTVHGVAGPGCLQALKESTMNQKTAAVLVAEMSSNGNLCDSNYTKGCIDMAKQYEDFVIGFIAQSAVTSDPHHIFMTPGVHMKSSSDTLGQKYKYPEEPIGMGTDIVIVGRGICQAKDISHQAMVYQEAAFKALMQRK